MQPQQCGRHEADPRALEIQDVGKSPTGDGGAPDDGGAAENGGIKVADDVVIHEQAPPRQDRERWRQDRHAGHEPGERPQAGGSHRRPIR
jgi:hypothetical protein